MTQAKSEAVEDWVKLAVKRAKISGQKTIFWLDEDRASDAKMKLRVKEVLSSLNLSGLDIEILNLKDMINTIYQKNF